MVLEPMVYEEKPDRRDGYNVQFGLFTTTSSELYDHVDFEYPFSSTPIVTVTPMCALDSKYIVSIDNVTNTGFDVKVKEISDEEYSGYMSSASSWTSVAKSVVTEVIINYVPATVSYIAIEKII
jgi:hypothetical protein